MHTLRDQPFKINQGVCQRKRQVRVDKYIAMMKRENAFGKRHNNSGRQLGTYTTFVSAYKVKDFQGIKRTKGNATKKIQVDGAFYNAFSSTTSQNGEPWPIFELYWNPWVQERHLHIQLVDTILLSPWSK